MNTNQPAPPVVWLIQIEPAQHGRLFDQLPTSFSRSVRCLNLESALRSLSRGIRPGIIILEGRPNKNAQTVYTQLQTREIDVPIFLISKWSGAGEIQSWLSRAIIESVRPRHEDISEPVNPYKLSQREVEILRCMVKGLIKKEIAEELSISYHTVDNHERNIFKKMNIHTRSGVVAKALIEKICQA